MAAGKRFYITTPIYYVTAKPHLGTSYTTIACDALARYHRLRGEEVLLATGTDEHAQKVVRAAEAAGVGVQSFVDGYAEIYKQTWDALHVEYDRFIRTTEADHKAAVQHVFAQLLATGDIYKGEYKGWYCVPCETYFPEAELVEGNCPDCGRPVEELSQPAYFLRLSAYGERLREHIEAHPEFVRPEFRRNEVLGFIRGGLQDVCVSRTGTSFGVPVPGDEAHVVYVWFDALINYLTVAGYPNIDPGVWPPDAQVMGKDILPRFHATIWPATLMALGVPLPRTLFGHGWWVSEGGDKMSKSRGNIVDPLIAAADLAELSGCREAVAIDTVRYFLLREVQFGLDGSFSQRALAGRFNADLANDLGNLLNRTLPLVQRYLGGLVPAEGDGALGAVVEAQVERAEAAMEGLDFRGYLEAIWELLSAGNRFVDEKQPWALHKAGNAEACARVLYDAVDLVRVVAILVSPVMPLVAQEIWRQLGLAGSAEPMALDRCRAGLMPAGTRTEAPEPIFPRVDMAAFDKPAAATPAAKPSKEAAVEYIKYEQFAQLELRVGKVTDVALVPDSDKLFQLTVDLGEEAPRTVVAGLAEAFGARELLDSYVVVVANLEPAKIRGVVSNGMVLAVGDKAPLALVTVDRDVAPGSKVR